MDDRDVRLARRFKIGLRLVFYPLALTLIVLAWQQRSHQGPKPTPPDVFWTGATSQGQRVAGRTTHDGVLTSLDTHIIETCSDGSTFTEHWFPAQHRFVQDGIAIRGHQGGRGQTYDGRPVVVDMALEGFIGAHPRGTLSARAAMTAVSCESGPVTFTLKRSG